MSIVYLNGSYVEESVALIPVRDTGLLHAAGVFTTMRAYSGKVFRLADHLQRLRRSCDHLFVPLQVKDELLMEAAGEVLVRNKLEDARLRLTVTRGAAAQDPLHGLRLEPTVLLTATEFEACPAEYYQRGMTVTVLNEQKLNPYDIQAGHKTLNYFSRLTALRDAAQRGAGEAMWFNVHNYLQSGSISNVFLVKAGRLLTPPTPEELLDKALAAVVPYPRSATLPGVTRRVVLELATQEGIATSPAPLLINDLLEADEVFLTNSIMGIMPVCRIERHAVGNDKPGPLTMRLADLYEQEVRRALA